MSRAAGPWTLRLLALAAAAVTALAAWGDLGSRLAEPLRQGRPIIGLLCARFAGQGGVLPPTLYLVVYGPAARSAELVEIPPGTALPGGGPDSGGRSLAGVYGDALSAGEETGAARAMADAAVALLRRHPAWPSDLGLDFRLDWELPEGFRPAYPGDLLRQIAAGRSDPYFWLRFPRVAARLLARERTGLGVYDAYLAAREYTRCEPRKFQLSRLPAPELVGTFLGRVFARPAGLPEPTGDLTVEILNATERGQLALKATKILRFGGFDVVHFGNARTLEPVTRVVDRVGMPGSARAALRALGCPETSVLTAMEKDPGASLTVVLGRDFARCTGLRN